jgi:predicted metal-dependent enzyme (double-stranded beta helix superfamily)
MFNLDRFIENCNSRITTIDNHKAVIDIVANAVENPNSLMKIIGEPKIGGIQKLYQSERLTILNVVWPANMTLVPHNHNMWAAVGIYTGREDNIFWKRVNGDESGLIEAAGAKSIGARESAPLGSNIIHSVTNPTNKYTGAIHVYGGDFYETPRSQWDTENLTEYPFEIEHSKVAFELANARANIK